MPGTPQTIAYLESKFETGDIPTQQDFMDLFASFLHFSKANGLVRHLGNCDLSTDRLPENGVAGIVGSGLAGLIEANNEWTNTVRSVSLLGPDGSQINAGIIVRAKIDDPDPLNIADWVFYYTII